MHSEVRRYSLLGSTERLRDGSAAKDTPGTWRMPHGPSVCEQVWVDISQFGQLEDIFNVRLVLVQRRWADEGRHDFEVCKCREKGKLLKDESLGVSLKK